MSNNDADSGVQHVERLLALAESLRALRVAVYHHEWYELAMGSPTTTPTNTLTAQAITRAIIQSPFTRPARSWLPRVSPNHLSSRSRFSRAARTPLSRLRSQFSSAPPVPLPHAVTFRG